jgi:hypothetical protein
MKRNRAVEESSIVRLAQVVNSALFSKNDCMLIHDSGNSLDAVGSWSLKYSNAPSHRGDVLGYIQVHVPCNETSSSAWFAQLVLSWVREVNFLHGYGGLSVNFDHGDLDKERNVAMRAYCERYLGVNLSDLVTERRALRNSIKGAQWLTFLGNTLLDEREEEAFALRSVRGAMSTTKGILIQACDEPLLGDRQRLEALQPYININAVLAPWLVENLFPMPGFPDEEAVREWLYRLRPPS